MGANAAPHQVSVVVVADERVRPLPGCGGREVGAVVVCSGRALPIEDLGRGQVHAVLNAPLELLDLRWKLA